MKDKYFDFLEQLRQSGKTNMLAAAPYLMVEFGVDKKEADAILLSWFEYKSKGGGYND